MAQILRFVNKSKTHRGCVVERRRDVLSGGRYAVEHVVLSHPRPLAEVAFSQPRRKTQNE